MSGWRHSWCEPFEINSRISVNGGPYQLVTRTTQSCTQCGQWRSLAWPLCSSRIKQGWASDEGGWKLFVIFFVVLAFLAWAALS